MAPRYRQPHTPQELRARRVRAAFLTCFAIFAVLVLLGTAWFGLVAMRRNPPYALKPDSAADGRLVFPIRPLLEEVSRKSPEAVRPDQQEVFAGAFARNGEILYWRADSGSPWLMFLPLAKPHRLFRKHLAEVLEGIPALAKRGTDGTPETLAFYELRPEGVILSPGSTFPAFRIVRTDPQLATEFRYKAEKGFVPPSWRRFLPEAGEGGSLDLRWTAPAAGETSSTVVLTVASPKGPADHRVPWFHPFWHSREGSRP